jgi:hypothetical protein
MGTRSCVWRLFLLVGLLLLDSTRVYQAGEVHDLINRFQEGVLRGRYGRDVFKSDDDSQ